MKENKIKDVLKNIGKFIVLTYAVFFAVGGIKNITYAWIAFIGQYLHHISVTALVDSSKAFAVLKFFTVPFDTMVLFLVYLIPAVILTIVANKVAKKYTKGNTYKRVRLGYAVLLLLSLYVI